MSLKQYTVEELEAELKRRKSSIPLPVDNPNLDNLKDACKGYLEDVLRDGDTTDTKQYIFEEAMQAFYGPNILAWVRQQL